MIYDYQIQQVFPLIQDQLEESSVSEVSQKQLNQKIIFNPKEIANQIKEVRTVFSEIPNKFLIECINEAEEQKMKTQLKFIEPKKLRNQNCQFLLEQKLQIFESCFTQSRFEKFKIIEEDYKLKCQDLQDRSQFMGISKALNQDWFQEDTFQPVEIKSHYDLENDEHYIRFMNSFQKCSQNALIENEKFKENTKQWRVAYDPYKSNKMLQIYGQNPPLSFKFRMRDFERQKCILQRYIQVNPIDDSLFHLNQMKRIFNMSRKDYLISKNFLKYVQDCDDNNLIESGINKGENLYIPDLKFDHPQWIKHEIYKDLRQIILSNNKNTMSEDQIPVLATSLNIFINLQQQSDLQHQFIINQHFKLEYERLEDESWLESIDLYRLFKESFFTFMIINVTQIKQIDNQSINYLQGLVKSYVLNSLKKILQRQSFSLDVNKSLLKQEYLEYLSELKDQDEKGTLECQISTNNFTNLEYIFGRFKFTIQELEQIQLQFIQFYNKIVHKGVHQKNKQKNLHEFRFHKNNKSCSWQFILNANHLIQKHKKLPQFKNSKLWNLIVQTPYNIKDSYFCIHYDNSKQEQESQIIDQISNRTQLQYTKRHKHKELKFLEFKIHQDRDQNFQQIILPEKRISNQKYNVQVQDIDSVQKIESIQKFLEFKPFFVGKDKHRPGIYQFMNYIELSNFVEQKKQ